MSSGKQEAKGTQNESKKVAYILLAVSAVCICIAVVMFLLTAKCTAPQAKGDESQADFLNTQSAGLRFWSNQKPTYNFGSPSDGSFGGSSYGVGSHGTASSLGSPGPSSYSPSPWDSSSSSPSPSGTQDSSDPTSSWGGSSPSSGSVSSLPGSSWGSPSSSSPSSPSWGSPSSSSSFSSGWGSPSSTNSWGSPPSSSSSWGSPPSSSSSWGSPSSSSSWGSPPSSSSSWGSPPSSSSSWGSPPSSSSSWGSPPSSSSSWGSPSSSSSSWGSPSSSSSSWGSPPSSSSSWGSPPSSSNSWGNPSSSGSSWGTPSSSSSSWGSPPSSSSSWGSPSSSSSSWGSPPSSSSWGSPPSSSSWGSPTSNVYSPTSWASPSSPSPSPWGSPSTSTGAEPWGSITTETSGTDEGYLNNEEYIDDMLETIPEDSFNPNFKCGVQKIKPNLQTGRVVGGSIAVQHSWPWVISLEKSSGGDYWHHVCGGTIVSPRHAITAMHCFDEKIDWEKNYRMQVGTHDPTTPGSPHYFKKVRKHPATESSIRKDLVLLTTAKQLEFSDKIQAACLPPPDVTLTTGRTCWAYGWGATHGTPGQGTLKQLYVRVVSYEECSATFNEPDRVKIEHAICAGDRAGHDTCQGDSGGPFTCQESDGRWVLYGATSWGRGCATGKPGVYASISYSMGFFCCFLLDLPACKDIECDPGIYF